MNGLLDYWISKNEAIFFIVEQRPRRDPSKLRTAKQGDIYNDDDDDYEDDDDDDEGDDDVCEVGEWCSDSFNKEGSNEDDDDDGNDHRHDDDDDDVVGENVDWRWLRGKSRSSTLFFHFRIFITGNFSLFILLCCL